MAAVLRRSHRATGPINQIDQRNAVFVGQILAETALPAFTPVKTRGRSAAHRKILTANHDRPPVDLRKPSDVRRRRHFNQLSSLGIRPRPRRFAYFLKCARIDKPVYAFTDR